MTHDSVHGDVRLSPHTDDVAPARPVTLRMLFLADLAPGREVPVMAVDRAGFAEVLAGLAPALRLRVPDRLGSGGRELLCELRFTELRSFQPDAIAAQVPALAELLEARRLLAARLAGEIDETELRRALPATLEVSGLRLSFEKAADRSDGLVPLGVDGLLAAVDVAPSPAALGAASLVDVLAAALAPATQAAPDRARLGGLIAELDERLTRQLAAICDEPSVRALESAWRGLKLVLDRCPRDVAVRVEVLPTGKEDFLQAFYDQVLTPEYQSPPEVALSLTFADLAFDRSQADLDALQHMARMAATLQAPFVGALSPEYFGVRQPALLASMPDPIAKCRSAEYAKWNRFRADELSLWVALAANRVLLRDGWGTESAPAGTFAWSGAAAAPLWGSAVWPLAAAAAQAFAAQGPRLPLAGPQPPAVLEDLPVRELRTGKGQPVSCPLEVMLTTQRAFEMSECGVAALMCAPDRDQAFFLAAPTMHAATRYDQEDATRASYLAATLPYQTFAGAAAHALDALARELGTAAEAEHVRRHIHHGMLAFLANCEPEPIAEEASVEIEPLPDRPGALEVVVRLQPVFTVYGGPVDLVIGTVVGA